MSGERNPVWQRLTRSQEQMWLAHQLAGEPGALGVPAILDIAGPVDAVALSRAFQALVDSNDILRMVVGSERGTPKAWVLPHVDASFEIVRADGNPDEFLERWVASRLQVPLRLDERLFDAALLVLADGRSVFYLNQHHLITDGWSVHIVLRHLDSLYSDIVSGGLPRPFPAPQFSEYADWSEGSEAAGERKAAAAYWAPRLATLTPVPALYGRPPRPDTRRAFQLLRTFGMDRSDRIYRAAGSSAAGERSLDRAVVAFFATCLAAYEVRVSGVSRVAIGIPYRNRPRAFEQTLGPFATVVPLIVSVDPSASFATLTEEVHGEMTGALEHGRHPVPHSRAQPAYHTLLNYRAEGLRTFAGAPASLRFCFSGRADEPLGLHINRLTNTREFALDFVLGDDVFDRERGERCIDHFLAVVDACLEDPQQRISEPVLVTDAERRRLLSWSRSPFSGGPAVSCVRMIEAAAIQRPAAIAAVEGALRVTYQDFVTNARGIAGSLRARGVGAETLVGIAMDRTAATYTAILGVLLAGGAYVPLDLRMPGARLKSMLEDAQVRYLITKDVQAPAVNALRGLVPQVVALEELWNASAGGDLPAREPDQLAYVIFTSGSTGRPKAVAITDGAMANHSAACRRIFAMTEHDRVLQFRTLTFDASIEEMFPAWTAGATLVAGPPALASDLDEFTAFVEAESITVMDLPTAFWHEWVRALMASDRPVPSTLRLVAVGGEQASSELLKEWSRRGAAGLRWVNMYGPTETSVTALAYEASTSCEDPVPIGTPIDNATAFILDAQRRFVPIGVPGDLYIGGAGLARGYVNRPDLTAQRFVASPFESGARLYVTGDVARHRDDGEIEYLGRTDDQLKIRGFRVEPAEIEHVLTRHPGVQQAVVLPRRQAGNQVQLAAYVAMTGNASDSDLRAFVRGRLPDYMVPAVIVRLDRLPLTDRGKVDKAALAAMPAAAPAPVHQKPRPRDLVVAQLLALWQELLGVPDVGMTDSFIDLGGHSLLGARMLYEISERFGRRLPFSVLFPDVTVEKLAAALQQAAPCDPAGAPVQVSHLEGSRPPLIFFHGDYRTGGLYAARLTRLLGPDQPLFIVHPHGMNGEAVPSTIEEMADDRLADILALLPPGPVIVGGYCNGGLVAYETGLRLSRMGRTVLATIAIDAAVRTTRFRALSRGVQRYAAYRGLKPREARDRFLTWRDRQATVEQLLDLSDHSRFGGFADRVAFVARSVGRNIPGARRRSGGEQESRAVSRTAEEARWAHYVAAIDAYVPATTSGRVVLLLSDDLLSMGADRAWRRLARNVEVGRIEGGHYECVTAYLATLAAAVAEAAAKAAAAAGIAPAAGRV